MSSEDDPTGGLLQKFTIDQAAGATALVLGSFGGLLMVIWKSRCRCRCRLGCSDTLYCFDCVREPPPPEEIAGDSDNEEGSAVKTKPPVRKAAPDPESLLPEPEPEVEPEPEAAPEPEPEPEPEAEHRP